MAVAAALAAVVFVACGSDPAPIEVTVPVTRVVDRDVTREVKVTVDRTVVVEKEVTRVIEVPATREIHVTRVVQVPVTVPPEVVVVTQLVEVTRVVEVEVQAEVTAQPDATSTPVAAPNATPTPAPTATPSVPPTPWPTAIPILYDVNSDREALIALYESTRGQRWTNNQNWLTSKPLAEWYGIQTNAAGRVTNIELKENGLRGTLPRELGRLEFLEKLWLDDNAVRGNIPSSIGGLTRLWYLSIAENDLSGSIPVSIGNLKQLWGLWLHGNHLTGSIPHSLGNLVNLEYLNLSWNQLSGQIPRSLGDILFKQVALKWYGSGDYFRSYGYVRNKFSGCVPDGLRDVAQRWLPAGNNLHSDLPYCVRNDGGSAETDRQALVDLYNRTGGANWKHNSNWLTDAPLSDWYGVRVDANGRVVELTLAQNGLTGQIPETIDTLSQLGVLDLAGNALTGNIPGTIGSLINLGSLLLQNNQLTGTVPTAITNLPGLILDIVGNLLE